MQDVIWLKRRPQTEEEGWPSQFSHNHLIVKRLCDVSGVDLSRQLVSNCKTYIFLVVKLSWIERVRVVVLAVRHFSVKVVYMSFIRS